MASEDRLPHGMPEGERNLSGRGSGTVLTTAAALEDAHRPPFAASPQGNGDDPAGIHPTGTGHIDGPARASGNRHAT